MSKDKILLFIGIVVAGLLNLGLPSTIEKIVFLVIGLIIIFFAYGEHFKRTKKQIEVKEIKKRAPRNIQTPPIKIATPKNTFNEEVTGFTYVNKETTTHNDS